MKNKKIISIIANGEKPHDRLQELILNSDVIIAADGGANHCAELVIKPDFIIGDLDSISSENRQKFCNSKIIQIAEQQTSDLEKALNFADTLSPSLIRIFSVFENRSDHAFYNLQILQKFDSKTEIEFYDNYGFWKIYRAGQNNLTGEIGENISFFSHGKLTKFYCYGFEYPVKFGDYEKGFFSLSNKFQTKKTKIKFTSGELMIYRLLPK